RSRTARQGETLRTLDGQKRTLDPEMLVIADKSRAQALAGIMGGGDSEVSATTGTIAIESAWFLPSSIRRTSKRLGLSTEASYRFERGADFAATSQALAGTRALLTGVGGGRIRSRAPHRRLTRRGAFSVVSVSSATKRARRAGSSPSHRGASMSRATSILSR